MTANSNSKTHLGMKSIKKIKINVWIFVQANESIKRHTLSRPSLCCSSIINSGCFLPIWKKKKNVLVTLICPFIWWIKRYQGLLELRQIDLVEPFVFANRFLWFTRKNFEQNDWLANQTSLRSHGEAWITQTL